MTVDVMALRCGPLGSGHLAVTGPELEMLDEPFRTLVDVRGGATAPVANGHVWQLGPDWWLVDAQAEKAPALEPLLAGELRAVMGDGVSLVDVSSHRTVFRLDGADALTVLSHGCSIDLERVDVGECVQGNLAQTQLVLGRTPVGWRLYPRASFARHLAAWLTDAALEYAHP